jgi:hypothetical protein
MVKEFKIKENYEDIEFNKIYSTILDIKCDNNCTGHCCEDNGERMFIEFAKHGKIIDKMRITGANSIQKKIILALLSNSSVACRKVEQAKYKANSRAMIIFLTTFTVLVLINTFLVNL